MWCQLDNQLGWAALLESSSSSIARAGCHSLISKISCLNFLELGWKLTRFESQIPFWIFCLFCCNCRSSRRIAPFLWSSEKRLAVATAAHDRWLVRLIVWWWNREGTLRTYCKCLVKYGALTEKQILLTSLHHSVVETRGAKSSERVRTCVEHWVATANRRVIGEVTQPLLSRLQ